MFAGAVLKEIFGLCGFLFISVIFKCGKRFRPGKKETLCLK